MGRKSIAVLLAFFLGVFGVHRFYINQPVRGIFLFAFNAAVALSGYPMLLLTVLLIELVYVFGENENTLFEKENTSTKVLVADVSGYLVAALAMFAASGLLYFLYRMSTLYWFK